MERYDVYLYDLPRVEANKVIPTKDTQTHQFPSVDDAKRFMAENRTKWDRIVLVETVEDKQKALERYRDGEIEPFPPPREEI
jgi:hypothetical protein